MKDFITVSPDNIAVMELIDELGWEGYGYLTGLLALYSEIGMFEVTPTILARRFGLNKRKSSRVLPKLSECFTEVLGSLPKVSESLPKLDASNPLPSTRAHARAVEVIEEEVISSPKPPKQESPEFKKFMKAYPKPNGRKDAWAEWHWQSLDSSLEEILEGLKAYLDCDDWTKENGKYIPNPLKFLVEQRWDFAPGQRLKIVTKKQNRVDILMAARRIRSVVDDTLFYDTCDLERDTFDQIYPKAGGPRIMDSEFVPVEEELEKHA